MSEIITGGYVELCDIVDGVCTALTLAIGFKSYAFNVEAETSTFTVDSAGDKATGSNAYAHSSVIVFHGNTGDNLVQIHAMNVGRHGVIAKCADGTYELLHMTNGGKAQSGRAAGTAYTDMNGSTITLTSNEVTYAPKISSAIVDALLIPAS